MRKESLFRSGPLPARAGGARRGRGPAPAVAAASLHSTRQLVGVGAFKVGDVVEHVEKVKLGERSALAFHLE